MKNDNKINYSIFLCIIISLASIIALVCISFYWEETSIWKNIIQTVLSTIAAIAGVETIWELISKKNFSEFIFNQIRINDNLKQSGICKTFKDYSFIKWEDELKGKTDLLVFFAHGHGWLKNNKEFALPNFLKNKGTITCCFANPFNEKLMGAYDVRFNYSEGQTKTKIKQSIEILYQIEQTIGKKHKIKIRFCDIEGTMSYYFLGKHNQYDSCICTLYNHSPNSGKAPAINVKKLIEDSKDRTMLFEFIDEEYNWIMKQSKENDLPLEVLIQRLSS